MSLVDFYQQLTTSGDVTLLSGDLADSAEVKAGLQYLLDFEEREYRQHLPAGIPLLEPAALEWAAEQFYRAAQFLVYRELGPELLEQDLSIPVPAVTSAGTAYSVDVVFRFLPDLVRIARTASHEDPLIKVLQRWSAHWPLSAVGLSITSPEDEPEPSGRWRFLESAGLRRLYLDRIMEKRDLAPLRWHPDLLEAVLLEPGSDWASGLRPAVPPTESPVNNASNPNS